MHLVRSVTLSASGLLLLAACGEEGSAATNSAAGDQAAELTVVTSIDVYADLVAGVTGDTVDLQPLVDSTAIDPHSYEATPQDRLAVENADLVIANGGGYDSFITLLASAADKDDAVYQLIDGEDEHSHESDGHSHESAETYQNEHIWYDLARMEEFVLDIGEHLGEQIPENADLYAANAEELAAQISALDERNRSLAAEGHSYLATEAVSGLLLEDAGMDNRTDAEFLNAVEHGEDVSPRLYSQALDTAAEIDVLSYNSQTETPQSQRIREAAEDSAAAVIEFTETIPEASNDYLDWMESNIDALEAALQDSQ